MVESKIINPKQVKYAISVEMFNNASSRDIPMGEQHKIERLKNSYIEDMKVLYQKYEDLEKLFDDGVSKNLTKIRNQAKNIAFYIHNLLDPELIVYHDGYKAYLNEFKSIFSFEEDLRKKSPYLKRLTNNIDLINQIKLLGLDLSKEPSSSDFVKIAIFDLYDLYIVEQKTQNSQYQSIINDCEECFDAFIASDGENRKTILPSFVDLLLTLPKDLDIESLSSKNKDFVEILKCVKIYLNREENPKELKKQVRTCQRYIESSPKQVNYGLAFSSLFLQYNGVFISKSLENIVKNTLKTNKESLDEKTDEEKTVVETQESQPENNTKSSTVKDNEYSDYTEDEQEAITKFMKYINRKKPGRKPKQKTVEQQPVVVEEEPKQENTEKLTKSSTIKDNEYSDYTKDEQESITKFMKYINRKKPGRKPKPKTQETEPETIIPAIQTRNDDYQEFNEAESKTIKQFFEYIDQETRTKNIKDKQKADEKPTIPQPLNNVYNPVNKIQNKNFFEQAVKAIEKLAQKLPDENVNFSANFEYKNGKVIFKNVKLDAFDISSEENDTQKRKI